MQPDLEVVQIRRDESFKAWAHGYPYRTVRWHFHPEYEIHQVVATSGHYFVGDFIGSFEPGNLVLTGPNLPHNWVSDVGEGVAVPLRGRIVQFSQELISGATAVFPELSACAGLLKASRRGVLFSNETSERAAPILRAIIEAEGIARIALFVELLALLSADGARPLAGAGYHPDPSGFMAGGINEALVYIDRHLAEPFTEGDLAAISGRSPSAFSRSFRRHTGMVLVQYVNRLRINLACQLLLSEAGMSVTEICYAAGYNNVSNFNRQFLAQKGMSPSRSRKLTAPNRRPVAAALAVRHSQACNETGERT